MQLGFAMQFYSLDFCLRSYLNLYPHKQEYVGLCAIALRYLV